MGALVADADHADAIAVVDRFLSAVTRADWEALEALYEDDVVVWHNFSDRGLGKNESIAGIKAARSQMAWSYDVIERLVIGDRVIQRHATNAVLNNGVAYRAHAALFVTVRGGRIARIDEYLDLTKGAAARAQAPNK